ncbi:insulinase family protein [Candidatus Shapirobacteria bacterium]|nr:insulinase family protein [Candidatus Shapirobacteria bacterium]
MNKIRINKLANGIRVVCKPLTGLKAITVEVLVGVGSKYEELGEHGLSHFVEHMMFKGTLKRPTAEIINKEIDAKGAVSNAGTGQETTSYYVTTVKEHREWAIELLSDILIYSTFDKKELLKEKVVISEEIKMYQDNPMSGLASDFTKFIWGGSRIGCWNISGETEEVLRYEQKDVVDYWRRHYDPNKVVIVMAGDLQGDELGLVEDYFSKWNSQDHTPPRIEITWATELDRKIGRKNEQGHFVMGIPGISSVDPRKYEFRILDVVLSGNSSSRLFQKIREDRGLAYYVYSVSESITEAGVWAVQSGVVKEKIDEAMDLVKQEILTIGNNLTSDEISRAKEYLRGRTKLAMDRTDFWTSYLGEKLLLENKLVDIEEELAKINKVAISGVVGLAKDLVSVNKLYSLKLV